MGRLKRRVVFLEEDVKEKVDFICQWHNRSMELIPGKYSLYRRCPVLLSNGFRCPNKLSILDCQRIYADLEYLEDQKELKPFYENRSYHIKYMITEVEPDYIAVKTNNLNTKKPVE